jgi:hypothetical protein
MDGGCGDFNEVGDVGMIYFTTDRRDSRGGCN